MTPEELRQVFKRKVRRLARAKGISIPRLAELSGVAPAEMQAYLDGESSPSIDVVARIAAVLDVHPVQLVVPD